MLVDTSVLLRTLHPCHPQIEIVDYAVGSLLKRGVELCIVPQNLVELWVVATRPVERNGLGLTPAQAAVELERIKGMFVLLPETPAIYPAWEALVRRTQCRESPRTTPAWSRAMKVHGLKSILTFDKTGFSRFPGIEVVNPSDVKPTQLEKPVESTAYTQAEESADEQPA